MEAARGPVEQWTFSDVQQWLSEQPQLARYAKDLEVTYLLTLVPMLQLQPAVSASSLSQTKVAFSAKDRLGSRVQQERSSCALQMSCCWTAASAMRYTACSCSTEGTSCWQQRSRSAPGLYRLVARRIARHPSPLVQCGAGNPRACRLGAS